MEKDAGQTGPETGLKLKNLVERWGFHFTFLLLVFPQCRMLLSDLTHPWDPSPRTVLIQHERIVPCGQCACVVTLAGNP